MDFHPHISKPIHALWDDELAAWVLGRTDEDHRRFGQDGLAVIGTLAEWTSDEDQPTRIVQDLIHPHVKLFLGVRGSGKSYAMGNDIEALAMSKLRVGIVVIDRCGVFLAMDQVNTEEGSIHDSSLVGVRRSGLPQLAVFSAGGTRHPGSAPYTICTAQMTEEDWSQFWSVPENSPRRDLIREILVEIRQGYVTLSDVAVKANDHFGLGDLQKCLAASRRINDPKEGFGISTIRSIAQKISSSMQLGIFDSQGTTIQDLAVPGQVTVLDLSDPSVDDVCASKIVGLTARNILASRMASVRDELEHIPVTWLFVDEAHLYVGSGVESGTAADLISYCKLGRKPGCALVLGTQQPSAMNRSVLSQADIVVAHRLVFAADIAALKKLVPAALPDEVLVSDDLVRALPVGTALVADKLTQQRAMIVGIRPRLSEHLGSSALPSVELITADADTDPPIGDSLSQDNKEDSDAVLMQRVQTSNSPVRQAGTVTSDWVPPCRIQMSHLSAACPETAQVEGQDAPETRQDRCEHPSADVDRDIHQDEEQTDPSARTSEHAKTGLPLNERGESNALHSAWARSPVAIALGAVVAFVLGWLAVRASLDTPKESKLAARDSALPHLSSEPSGHRDAASQFDPYATALEPSDNPDMLIEPGEKVSSLKASPSEATGGTGDQVIEPFAEAHSVRQLSRDAYRKTMTALNHLNDGGY